MTEPISVTKTIAVMMRYALEGGASSIHIEPERHYTRIRFRVGSGLKTVLSLPVTYHEQLLSRLKLISQLSLDEEPSAQHGMGAIEIDGKPILFSIATMPLRNSEKAVIHLSSDADVTVPSLGFREANLERLQKGLAKSSGLFVIAGPTGAGKTTTGYALLQERQRAGRSVAAIEYPIKRFLPGVAQMGLQPKEGLDIQLVASSMGMKPYQTVYASARTLDGVGELARLAVGGKFVLMNVQAINGLDALKQLVKQPGSHLFATQFHTLVSQVTVPRICPICGSERAPSVEEGNWIRSQLAHAPACARQSSDVWRVGQANGCDACYGTGYRGKIVLSEVVHATPELRQQLAFGNVHPKDFYAMMHHQDALTITSDAAIALINKETTPDMLWRSLPASLISTK